MKTVTSGLLLCSIVLVLPAQVDARVWSDATGAYSLEADLVGFDDENVVLRRSDKELGVASITSLSKADQDYLATKAARDARDKNLLPEQTWTTNRGTKLVGRIVDYVSGDLTLQRRRGRLYVNQRRFDNLPQLYQDLLPELIEHFDGVEVSDEESLQRWVTRLRGRPRVFHLDGVTLELDNGDEYSIPFFAFTESDQQVLMAGWEDWLRVKEDYDLRDDFAFRLETLAAAFQQDRAIDRQIALMDLNLQAINAGLTSAWEVTLYPAAGNPSPPRWVVSAGRNSAQATASALQRHPGFVAGPVRRLNPR